MKGNGSMALLRATLGTTTAGDTDVVARYTSGDYANDARLDACRL